MIVDLDVLGGVASCMGSNRRVVGRLVVDAVVVPKASDAFGSYAHSLHRVGHWVKFGH